MAEATFTVEYVTLDRNAYTNADEEIRTLSRQFGVYRWNGTTEAKAREKAQAYADKLSAYHTNVEIFRVGPRGGRELVGAGRRSDA